MKHRRDLVSAAVTIAGSLTIADYLVSFDLALGNL